MLRSGDIMFRKGNYHHTMIISDPKTFESYASYKQVDSHDIEVIHAASVDSAVFREDINIETGEISGNNFTFYRPADPRLRFGIEFAKIWSRYRTGKADETRGAITQYSYNQLNASGADMSRYSGVQQWLHSGHNPPLEFDGLYRAFKWATRQRTGFSNNRGTTCCAFITACFQASCIVDLVNSNYPKLYKGFEILKALRGNKLPKEQRINNHVVLGGKKKKISHRPLRQYSNAGGFSERFSVDDYCRFVTKEIIGREKSLSEVFPPALLVDAKYNYSANFESMIRRVGSGWHKIMKIGCEQGGGSLAIKRAQNRD
ncbi:MAG: hypothetical protein OEZ39_12065 [Gammaproteobacteria bacterium]|nr:hypothetical protein [Gammaproteobacteria bacterium]MDH5652579.1 hypothetical protein [Gammaproteobacteria bacterium]